MKAVQTYQAIQCTM